MKRYIFILILLFITGKQQAQAQGIPQFKVNNPTPGEDTLAYNFFTRCENYSHTTAFDLNWFQPALPRKGTITSLFFHIPKLEDTIQTGLRNFDTILAGSPIIGARVRMTLSNYKEIGDIAGRPNSCIKPMNFTTVFNTPVYYVPSALQGDDTTKCWLRLPLIPPFSYDADAPLGENDTSTYRNLVIELINDSLNVYRLKYDPVKNTSYIGGRAYLATSYAKNKTVIKQGPNSCNLIAYCTGYPGMLPVIGLDLAPNSIEDVSGKIRQLNFSPNPATNKSTLSFEAKEKIGRLSITLTGITGKVIKTETYQHVGSRFSREIDLSALPRGVYIAELRADGERIVRKLVVQ